MRWTDHTILVTGASGFIGGRMCERLIQAGHRRVRAMVHDPCHAARIARLPLEIICGDLLDQRSLRHAMGDADIVIHLGLGYGGAIVRGTRNILGLASESRAKRVVHVSTAAVYGLKPDQRAETEDAPLRKTGNIYCDNKLRAELVAQRFIRNGLPVVILRPSIVYGPYSRWCTGLVQNLQQGRVMLIDGGEGICNTTYVDNLIDAIFLAIENDEAIGEALFITDGEKITWEEFIAAHQKMIGVPNVLQSISSAEVLAYHRSRPGLLRGSLIAGREVLFSQDFRKLMKRIPICDRVIQELWDRLQNLTDTRKEYLRRFVSDQSGGRAASQSHSEIPDRDTLAIQTGTVYFKIDKARRLLGYSPKINFSRGIHCCEQWLRFANCLPSLEADVACRRTEVVAALQADS